MNKLGQIYGLEEFNFLAAALAILGALGAFWYAGRFLDAGIASRILSAIFTGGLGYFVASYILER